MAPRVLVTGGSGFIGRQAIRALSRAGADVHATSRSEQATGLSDVACTWHVVDLLTPGAADRISADVRPDIVLHLAWIVEHGKFWTSPLNLDWTAATLALARASVRNKTRRFIGVGTCYEYDWPSSQPCVEGTTPVLGHTLYDRAKTSCQSLLSEFCRQTEVEFAWARIFFPYGLGESPNRLVSSIARALVAGQPAPVSRGLAIRDFMDVRDAGAALAAVALSNLGGPVNVATGEPHSVRDVALMLGTLADAPELIHIGALPDREEPPYIVGSNQRLFSDVGFVPAYDLRTGLEAALAFWRDQARPRSERYDVDP